MTLKAFNSESYQNFNAQNERTALIEGKIKTGRNGLTIKYAEACKCRLKNTKIDVG